MRWILLTLAMMGCRSSDAKDAGTGCPSAGFMEAVHAATFHFEHGVRADGRFALERARAMEGPRDATSAEVLGRLAVVEKSLDSEPVRAQAELELTRLAFRDWACLPEELHQRFHQSLPPLR